MSGEPTLEELENDLAHIDYAMCRLNVHDSLFFYEREPLEQRKAAVEAAIKAKGGRVYDTADRGLDQTEKNRRDGRWGSEREPWG